MNVFTLFFIVYLAASITIGILKGRKLIWQYNVARLSVILLSVLLSVIVSKLIAPAIASPIYSLLESEIFDLDTAAILSQFSSIGSLIEGFLSMVVAILLFIPMYVVLKFVARFFLSPLTNLIIGFTNKKESKTNANNTAKIDTDTNPGDDATEDSQMNKEEANEEIETETKKAETLESKGKETKKRGNKQSYLSKKPQAASIAAALVCSLIGMIVFLAPITGTIGSLSEVIYASAEIVKSETDDEDLYEIIDTATIFTEDFSIKAVNFAGGKLIYNSLATAKVNGVKIKLQNEIDLVATILTSANKLTDCAIGANEQKQALQGIEISFNKSAVLPLVISDVITVAIEAWENGDDFLGISAPASEKNASLSSLYLDALRIFKNSTAETIKGDINSIIGVIETVIDYGILAENDISIEQTLSNKDFTHALLTKLFANNHLKELVNTLADLGISTIAENLGIPDTREGLYDEMLDEIIAAYTISENSKKESALLDAFHKYGIDITTASVKNLAQGINSLLGYGSNDLSKDSIKPLLASITVNTASGAKVVDLSSKTCFEENSVIITTSEITSAVKPTITNADKEALALSEALASVSDLTSLSFDEGVSSTLKTIGKALDKFALTDTIGRDRVNKLIIALLQSGTLGDSVNMNAVEVTRFAELIIKGSENESYEALMIRISNTVDTLSSLASGEETTNETIEAVLKNLTPETASAIEHLITPELISEMGVSSTSSEAVANILSEVFSGVANAKSDMSEDEYNRETQKISNILDITMSMTSGDQSNEELNADNYVDSIMESNILSSAVINSVYQDGDEAVIDPLGTGRALSESEKTVLEESLSEKLRESAEEDKEQTKKLVTAVAAYMNTKISIDGDSVTVIENP